MSLIAGTLSANYLTPLAITAFGLQNSSSQYAVAFMLGFLGLRGVEYILDKLGIGPK
jgi:hypothetical protein